MGLPIWKWNCRSRGRFENEIVASIFYNKILDFKMKLWYNMYSEKYIVIFGGIFYPYL